ncbi:MAG: copper resistance protein NlpE [Tannerellaceae bacterium]|nr:copper resistance protein NlpE [Tannerellaceae bacterium]
MKNIYFVLLIVLMACFSCSRNKNKIHYEYELPQNTVTEEEDLFAIPVTVNIQDSLVIKKNMGEVVEMQYEGVLPAADGPGIRYELDIWKQEESDEGVFWLSTTYLGDQGEEDHTYVSEGYLHITPRIYEGNNEKVYSLAPLDGSTPLYFVLDGEDLTMLDRLMGHISSKTNLNYTLKKK